MKVLYIAAECKPYSKVGGVGDVAGELPAALKAEGVEIEVVTPFYEPGYSFSFNGREETAYIWRERPPQISPVPVYFVRSPGFFGGRYGKPYVYSENIPCYDDALRFSFFSEACLQLIKDKKPDIVHVNDWVLGFLFGRMAMEQLPSKRVLTIHNIGYQGSIGIETIRGWTIEALLHHDEFGELFREPPGKGWNNINALRLGIELAHRINTVSPNYAKEITRPDDKERFFEGGNGLEEVTRRLYEKGTLVGILNGFEYKSEPTDDEFNRTLERKAEMKRSISIDFDDPDAFLLGFVGRAVQQKFRLLTEEILGKMVIEHILDISGINVAILATGNPDYERILKNLAHQKRKNCSITIEFDKQKAEQISVGSDVFLMPSLFEPCGITQMESLSNATPPLVRWTGGLVDTVKPYTDKDGTGFGFDGSTREEILNNEINTIKEAQRFYAEKKDDFKELQRRGFNQRFLWSTAAKEYIEKLYEPALSEI